MENIKFLKILNKKRALNTINTIFKRNEDILKAETLPFNLQECLSDFYITVSQDHQGYYVDLNPKSGEGHDFGIHVNTKTASVTIDVGELISEPDDFDE